MSDGGSTESRDHRRDMDMSAAKRVVLAAVTVACVLAVFASIATASRAIRTSERVITLQSSALSIEAAGFRIVCEAKFTFNVQERILKRVAAIGEITGEVLGQNEGRERCEGGTARVLPFAQTLVYVSFTGTLPAITGINFGVEQLRILITAMAGLIQCLIESAAEGLQSVAARTGLIGEWRGFTLISPMVINLGLGACPRPAEVRIRGTFSLTSPRTVRVELIT